MSEKIFSSQEVITLTATLLGANPQDLIEKIEDNDLSSLDSISSFIKPFATKFKNELREESLNKGYRQAAKKTERLWQEVFNQDITGKKLEDLFMEQKQLLSDKGSKNDKSKLTLQQALQSEEVRQHIEELKQKASKADEVENSFSAYKNLMQIKQDALDELTKRGAKFSSNSKVKALQMAALEDELSSMKFKRDIDGNIIILDEDGESPLYNKNEAANWNFGDYLQHHSPLDFEQPQSKKQDKNTFTPDNKGGSSSTFGFSQSQISKLGYEDYKRALDAGEAQKADFIKGKMYENLENNK